VPRNVLDNFHHAESLVALEARRDGLKAGAQPN